MRLRQVYAPVRQCRECGSHDVMRSHERGFREHLMRWFLRLRPYRCRACSARYFGSARAVRAGSEHREAA